MIIRAERFPRFLSIPSKSGISQTTSLYSDYTDLAAATKKKKIDFGGRNEFTAAELPYACDTMRSFFSLSLFFLHLFVR